VRAALAGCAARGIPVVAVTARRWRTAAPLVADLGIGPWAIAAGGTAVRSVRSGRVVLSTALPGGVAGRVAAIIAGAGLQPVMAVDHGELHLAGDPRADGPATARYLRRGGLERGPLDRVGERPVARVLAMGPWSRVQAAWHRCAGLPCHRLLQPCIVQLDACGERAAELHCAAASKGTALRGVCRLLGIAPAGVLAVGDSPSDLPMLELARIAVLMGQAEAGLRRPGFVVAPPVTEDGAAWALEHFVLDGHRGR